MSAFATLPASIPSPPFSSIEIGPRDLRMYGLMIALGVVAAVWLTGKRLEERGLGDTEDASSVAIWGVTAGIIGARLYHVATEWSRFSDDLGEIPKVWEPGLGIPGGLLAGVAVGLWQAKRRGIDPMPMLTIVAPAIPLAQAIGRWGNWFNQELFGKPTDLPWAIEIDADHNQGYPAGTTFHPTFLYESLWNLGVVAALLWIDRRFKLGPGRLFACYLIGYGAGRFWIEALRIDPTEASDVAGMRFNQWVALAAIAGGVIWLLRTRGSTWPEPALDTGDQTDELAGDDLDTVDDGGGDPGAEVSGGDDGDDRDDAPAEVVVGSDDVDLTGPADDGDR